MKRILLEKRDIFDTSPHPTRRYKGAKAPSSHIASTETMKQIRGDLYPMLENAMAGKGFGPESLTNMRWDDIRSGYRQSFDQSKSEFDSQAARVIAPGDNRVKSFLDNAFSRELASGMDAINRQQRLELKSDEQVGRGMTADALAQERRMAVSGAQSYNAALQTQMADQRQFGTFGTNLMGNVGSGMMDYYFANKIAGGQV